MCKWVPKQSTSYGTQRLTTVRVQPGPAVAGVLGGSQLQALMPPLRTAHLTPHSSHAFENSHEKLGCAVPESTHEVGVKVVGVLRWVVRTGGCVGFPRQSGKNIGSAALRGMCVGCGMIAAHSRVASHLTGGTRNQLRQPDSTPCATGTGGRGQGVAHVNPLQRHSNACTSGKQCADYAHRWKTSKGTP